MKLSLGVALLLVVLLAVPSHAQWQFVKAFPDTNFKYDLHGIAVDPDGKVWIQPYFAIDSIFEASSSTWRHCRVIRVFNPDGTPAAIDKIKVISKGTGPDTLYNSNKGARTYIDGNILLCNFDGIFKVNYKTGAGLVFGDPYDGNSMTAPAVDSLGEIFLAPVIPGAGPIAIFGGTDFTTSIGTVVDSSIGYSRSFEVSKDGNDVYWAGYTNGSIYRYHSDFGSFGPYVLADTAVMWGVHSESMAWNKKDGYLYVSAGSDNDPPTVGSPWVRRTWYAYNPKTNQAVHGDTIAWNGVVGTTDPRPRGIAFSVSGDTAYVIEYNANGGGLGTIPACQMFVRGPASVEPIGNVLPETYNLSQNFPNPFNPTTEIQFSVPVGGNVTLKVFDILGNEVTTLVNQHMNPGSYSTTLDASKLSSGTYIYSLIAGSTRITKKMMLIK